ncbi:MAG: nitroreductase family protein [Syntrophobacteraceae bacterium]
MEAILGRRSIRKYKSQPVPENLLKELLEAGMAAPSAGNERPWHFIILDDRNLLEAIPKFHPYSQMLKEAPVAIVVCGDLNMEVHQGYWVQDCSAATENILVAARALGLGAVWLGVYPVRERVESMRKLLSLPDHVIPLCVVSLGYPAEEKPPAGRYDATRIRKNGW